MLVTVREFKDDFEYHAVLNPGLNDTSSSGVTGTIFRYGQDMVKNESVKNM